MQPPANPKPPEPSAATAPPVSPRKGPFEVGDAVQQVFAAVEVAVEKNRRVLVLWGHNDCEQALVLDELFKTDLALSRTLLYEYDLVHVDVGQVERNMEAAKIFRADLEQHGLPFLTVVGFDGMGATGNLTHFSDGELENQPMTPFELPGADGPRYDPARLLEFLLAKRAPARRAEAHLAAGLADAARQEKRLLVVCGAPWSDATRNFEDWMRSPEVAAILEKDLVRLGIDVERDRDGRQVMQRLRGTDAGALPWFAVLDAEGELLAHAGDTSFPATDPELSAFVEFLSRVAIRITPGDLGVLRRSLVDHRDAVQRTR